MVIKAGIKERRSPSAAETERLTPEEGEAIHGKKGWLDCVIKALMPHDKRRNLRRRASDKKAEMKAQKKKPNDEQED